jgi:hypothetical protein
MRSGRKKRRLRRCRRGGHRTRCREVWPRRRHRYKSASASVAVRQHGKKRGDRKNVTLTCGSHMLSQLVRPRQSATSAKPSSKTAEGVKLNRF